MTNDTDRPVRPRLVPDHALPPYAYVPGQHPHPVRDPRGHSFGLRPEDQEPPNPQRWCACGNYLYGINLFNRGYYWEAHEVWEGLWTACGRRGAAGAFFQGLIALAAAGLKVRLGNVRGVTGHAQRAAELFDRTAREAGPCEARYMGLMAERNVIEEIDRDLFANGATLLCTEPTPERCHRRLAAEYLQGQLFPSAAIVHL